MTHIIAGHYHPQHWYGLVTVDGKPLSAKPSLRLRNHSPTGFAWGYDGSGPAQLALGILLAVGVPPTIALQVYQDFKRKFIAPLRRESFVVSIDIDEWLRTREVVERKEDLF